MSRKGTHTFSSQTQLRRRTRVTYRTSVVVDMGAPRLPLPRLRALSPPALGVTDAETRRAPHSSMTTPKAEQDSLDPDREVRSTSTFHGTPTRPRTRRVHTQRLFPRTPPPPTSLATAGTHARPYFLLPAPAARDGPLEQRLSLSLSPPPGLPHTYPSSQPLHHVSLHLTHFTHTCTRTPLTYRLARVCGR